MLSIIGIVVGLIGSLLPELLKYFNRKADNLHELKMFEMRLKMAGQEHLYRMEEVSARADIEEAKLIHSPQVSYGIQLLDAAHAKDLPRWLLGACFSLFIMIDAFNTSIRPLVTFSLVGLYTAVKWAQYDLFWSVAEDATRARAIAAIWHEEDWALLLMVLSYWFGQRGMKYAFGDKSGSKRT